MSRLRVWLIENESENFSAAYIPTWVANGFLVPLAELSLTLCRLLTGASASASIPAALADRLEDTNVADETAVQSF